MRTLYCGIKVLLLAVALTAVSVKLMAAHDEYFNSPAQWDFEAMMRGLGYAYEVHHVTTRDGYVNTVFRLGAKRDSATPQRTSRPVLLMHGLACSSDVFLLNGEDKSPAFMLAARGYDVWLPNNRGNVYSRAHTTLSADDDAEYWDFSFEELALYDVPAFVAHVANVTRQKVTYIGHSQGATLLLMALAEGVPEATQLVEKFVALGPVAYVQKQRSRVFQALARTQVDALLNLLRVREVLRQGALSAAVQAYFCTAFNDVCREVMRELAEDDPDLTDFQRLPVILGHYPAGTSLKVVQHWMQLSRELAFRKFDYGPEENLRRYASPVPPSYNLSNIMLPVNMIVGTLDKMGELEDAKLVYQQLNEHAKGRFSVQQLGHATYIWGRNMSYFEEVFELIRGDLA